MLQILYEMIKKGFFKETEVLPRHHCHGSFPFLLLVVVTLIHFSIPLVATWDTAHYHNYLDILYGNRSWETWDVIRGPVFPIFIAAVHFLFGYNNIGMLLGTYIVTVLVLFIATYFIRELSRNVNVNVGYSLLFVFLFLNPIFLGFYHTLLTEFMASFLTIFSVFISYCWFYKNISDRTKFSFILLSIILVVIVTVSFHIKQPYVAVTMMPLLGASLLSIMFEKKAINIIQRLLVVVISLIFLIGSVQVWHNFLPKSGIAANKERMSYYMVSDRLYRGLQSQLANSAQFDKKERATKGRIARDVVVGEKSLRELSLLELENDKTINFIDRNRALRLKSTGEEASYIFLFIADSEGKIIDKILVGGKPGIARSAFELIRVCIAHPFLSLRQYGINFLQITRLIDNPWLETETIAFKAFEAKDFGNNVFWVAPYFEPLIAPYKQSEINFIGSIPYTFFRNASLWMFPLLLNIMSFLWVLLILYVLYDAVKKKTTRDNGRLRNNQFFVFLFISSFTIFFQIFFPHALLGAVNDRYAFPAYSLSLIVFVIILLRFIGLIKERLIRIWSAS